MSRFYPFLGVFALLSSPVPALGIEVPDGLRPAWERLAAAHPVPRGIDSGSIIVRDGPLPGFKVVDSTFLVPVARFWEAPPPVTRALVGSGRVRLLPIESVVLPEIALPIDGLFPGDPGYPLQHDIAVGIRGDDPALLLWFESIPELQPGAQPRMRWIGAVGDVMPARGVDETLLGPGGEQRVFGDTLPLLGRLDILMGNLEAAATRSSERTHKTYTFRFDPRALELLAAAGFSYLSLANNHTFDYGSDGFTDTLEGLARAGIATSGAGRTARDASQPVILNVPGMEVRLLSFGAYPVDRTGFDGRIVARASGDRPGTLWLDEEGIASAALGFSPQAFNVALVHGGVEWSNVPTAEQRRRYRELVQAGADLVIGSHSHVLQGLEAVDGRLIAYSLGNFLFPGMEGTPGGEKSAILEVGIWNRKIVSLRIVPVQLHGGTVRLDLKQDTLAAVRSLSRALNAPH